MTMCHSREACQLELRLGLGLEQIRAGEHSPTSPRQSSSLDSRDYKSLVRPHLEYYTQACRPSLQQDVNLLESVQRRMTRMIPGWADKYTYEERLRKLHLTTLETQKLRADLLVLEAFKILFKPMFTMRSTQKISSTTT